jgi:hydrogenase maturation protease
MAARIVCIGNRYAGNDDFGPRVYDALAALPRLRPLVQAQAGEAGLDLLRLLDDGRDLVLVDAVEGFAAPGALAVLDGAEVARQADGGYGHEAGLPFLLNVLPLAAERMPARITLVGCEGAASDKAVQEAARLSLRLAGEQA